MAVRVAVVGLAFRFPGTSKARYWTDLLQGRDLVTEVQAERWAQDAYLHPEKAHPGTSYTFAAGSIGDVSGFDAGFFGISPREAALMDPQQRVLLELAWETLEHAGVPPSALRGSDCGVYLGVAGTEYSHRFSDDLGAIDASIATGNTLSVAANRISYLFDLHGPSLAIDTACSSSLVAFHQACQAIASGEISQALAGGISLHLHPFGFIIFSKASMLSPRGRCNVFDASGDGYVRAEGGGLFLLKDYDRAVADGDRILAVVAGSAVNTDGRKNGLTVPSAQAQCALMQRAYAQAGIDPAQLDYLEAHGTGTAVGDPIETRAIGQALGQRRAPGQPLPIGSVKSNMGHLEAASGVAGLVKAIHALQHRTVPATIGIKTLNPNIDFQGLNLQVVTENRPLRPEGVLTVGVNSFGFGGANAHVILQSHEPPGAPAPAPAPRQDQAHGADPALPVLVSGKSAQALQAAAAQMAAALAGLAPDRLYDAAWQSLRRREWHEHRALAYARTPQEAAALLAPLGAGEQALPRALACGTALQQAQGPVFVYSGNGSQWPGMGRALLADPVFLAAVREVDALFEPLAGWRLLDLLQAEPQAGQYVRTEHAQPALFAVQLGMTRMLAQRGIVPAAVAGHSVGEIAAAWACGALSLPDAVKVIFHRSRLQGRTKGVGAMSAVGLDGAQAEALLAESGLAHAVCVAGLNSRRGATLAGDPQALAQVEQALEARRVFQRRLDLDYAFHSPAMDPIKDELLQALEGLRPQPGRLPYYSTVTGARLDGAQLDAGYWWRNVRLPVQFEGAVQALVQAGHNVFVEVGPHTVLRGYVSEAFKTAGCQGRVLACAVREDDAPARIDHAAGQVALSGAAFDWQALLPQPGRHLDLPGYPWQRERHWHPVTGDSMGMLERRKVHPLLGYPLGHIEHCWENHLDTHLQPLLADHVVGGAVVFPGAGYAEMGLAAGRQWQPQAQCLEIEELEILAPLLLAAQPSKISRLTLDPADGRFYIKAKDAGSAQGWTNYAAGRLLREPGASLLGGTAPQWPARPADFDGAAHYAACAAAGLAYGPAFQAIVQGWREDAHTVVAQLRPDVAPPAELQAALLHPALLDNAFQLAVPLLHEVRQAAAAGLAFVPARLGRLALRLDAGAPQAARVRLCRRSPHSLTLAIELFDGQGRQVAAVHEARFRAVRLHRAPADALDFLDYASTPRPVGRPPATVAPEAVHGVLQDAVRQAQEQGLHSVQLGEIEPLLETLCDRYAAAALRALCNDAQDLPQAVLDGVAPALQPWVAHLAARAQAAGCLVPAPHGWRLVPDPDDAPGATDIWNALAREYPQSFPLAHAAGRLGMHAPALLGGQLALAQVLPRAASAAALGLCSWGDGALRGLASALAGLLRESQQRLPAGRRLAVLEIGALPPLAAPACCAVLDFHVADYSYATFGQAAQEAAGTVRERYPDARIEDLADPQADQGTPADLVLLHADFDALQDGLAALRIACRRLKPGGMLVLRGTHPAAWADFVFGAAPDWWIDTVDAGKASSQRAASYWQAALSQQGLEDVRQYDYAGQAQSGPYLLAARCPAAAAPAEPVPAAQAGWLLLADAAGPGARWAQALAQALRAAGQRVALHEQADPDGLAGLLAQARAELGTLEGVIHLDGLAGGPGQDADPPARLAVQVRRCALAAALARACVQQAPAPDLWLLTAGAWPGGQAGQPRDAQDAHPANDAALWGFGRTLMNEASGHAVRLAEVPGQPHAQALQALVRELLAPDAEQEILLDPDGARHAPRLAVLPRPQAAPAGPQADTCLRLGFDFPGQLRNLQWMEQPAGTLGEDQIEVRVQATGLNFRDVMYALGLLSDEAIENGYAGPTLGLEFSGVVLRTGARVHGYAPGDAVVGFGPASFSDRVQVGTEAVAHLPRGCGFEAAATIPSTFFTVYYALHHLARLAPGERILIHGAAGGVGIAAIQMAQYLGAQIYATAGSDEKRDYLRLMGVQHIFDSRSLSFADEILACTDGQGVDVVLNSLAGEAINRNLRVLRPFGRFLELGKRDFYENTRIGLRPFRNNISYFGIDADQLMRERPDLTRRLFGEMMALFEQGVLHPLPYRSFDANDVVEAFRHMQQARQIGKIVVTYEQGIHARKALPRPAQPLSLSAQACYLVTGGLGGFGLRTAMWLAERGARHLVLVSRSGPVSEEARQAIGQLQARGVRVHAAACDITDGAAVAELFEQIASSLPALKGVVHAAMVIDDGLAQHADAAQISRVLAPKVLGALHLDRACAGLALDFFVLYSSATTLFGNPGQASYVAANAWLERLAQARRARGLPATCVRWGAIDDVGYLARNTAVKEALQSRMGGAPLASAVALQALEDMLRAGDGGMGVMELDWRALARFLPTADTPKFSAVAARAGDAGGPDDGGQDLARMLAELDDEALLPVLQDMLCAEIGEILRVPPERIDREQSVYDMGLDSLMGVELVVALENRFGVRLPVMALNEDANIAKLSLRLLRLLRGDAAQADEPLAAQVQDMMQRHGVQEDPALPAEEMASELAAQERNGNGRRLISD
ncbi:SDR family NAD(P)-dependent oxidoreductase [Orrella sp. JC864]|uniref:SDR family NAD(P)-dependent oxidoreductase n=1 Tax=Orrella sp. JC864 TaxID=3120298 RepID=UPI0030091632